MMNTFRISGLIVTLSLFLGACAQTHVGPQGLYDELGGKSGIDKLTSTLLDKLYADERIAFLFEDSDRDNLQKTISNQICEETGGPCQYEGLSMREAHSGLKLRASEFDAFVEDFILAMEAQGIDYRTQNRVLAIFAPMRKDVIDQ